MLDVRAQAARAAVSEDDQVIVSVGTNDAAPRSRVSVAAFAHALSRCLQSVPARRWVYVTPPGVEESGSTGSGGRTNDVIDEYRAAAVSMCDDAGVRVVHTERVIEPLGASAFVSDGLHLSGRAYRVVLAAIAHAVRSSA